MRQNVHFLTRQAARERVAADRALTQPAKERHLKLASRYAAQADSLHAEVEERPAVAPTTAASAKVAQAAKAGANVGWVSPDLPRRSNPSVAAGR